MILIHCESGMKALFEKNGVLTYWVRWRNAWIPTNSPLRT